MVDDLREELQGYGSKLTKLRFQTFMNPSKDNFSAVVDRCSRLENKFSENACSLESLGLLEEIQSLYKEKIRAINGTSPGFSYSEFAGFLRNVSPVSIRKDFVYELIAHRTGIGIGDVEAIVSSRVNYKSYDQLMRKPSGEVVREFMSSVEDK
ncbi:hypothetical protein K9L16_01800 [Candidatus Pacearchaeota archaeon]|nr:hypothetical protein [Candidatus Pacearchaeota archaeon]